MSLLGYYFLFYIGFFLPFVSYRSLKRIRANSALPSSTRVYVTTIILATVLLSLAILTARDNWIFLFQTPKLGIKEWLIGAAALTLKLGFFWFRHRTPKFEVRRTIELIAPRTSGQKLVFCAMAAMAAISEEAAYRGVAFTLFSRLLNNTILGTLASAIAFGLGHQTQGPRTVLIVILHALVDQVVVYLTGTLYIAMGIHFIYDAVAGMVLSKQIAATENRSL
jgi:membrane protease YdiL (CAAX protease family)